MDILLGIATTVHLGMAGDYNEVHPSVQLRFDGPIAGAYHNSEDALSLYAGYRHEWDKVFVEGGVVTGYTDSVVPYVRTGVDFGNVTFFVAPGIEYDDSITVGTVIGVELTLKVN